MKTAKWLAGCVMAGAMGVVFVSPLAAACMAGYALGVWFLADINQTIDEIDREMLQEARRMNDILEQ